MANTQTGLLSLPPELSSTIYREAALQLRQETVDHSSKDTLQRYVGERDKSNPNRTPDFSPARKHQYVFRAGLRLTCRQINAVVEQDFFSEVCLDLNRLDDPASSLREVLVTLGSETRPMATYVQRLTIAASYHTNGDPGLPTYSGVAILISQAMRRMVSLNSLIWHFDSKYTSSGINDAISQALTSLSCLQKLTLTVRSTLDIPHLHPLPDLRSFSFRCKYSGATCNQPTAIVAFLAQFISCCLRLDELSLEFPSVYSSDYTTAKLTDLLSQCSSDAPLPLRRLRLSNVYMTIDRTTLPQLQCIEVLRSHVDRQNSGTLVEQILPLCREDGTSTLRSLDINSLGQGARSLIPSSDLVKLSISIEAKHQDTELYRTFFATPLPGHASTLVSLCVYTDTDSCLWCYNQNMAAFIASCEHLRELSISVREGDLSGAIVSDILNNLRSLDYLSFFALFVALIPQRQGRCGTPRLRQRISAQKQLASNVEAFRAMAFDEANHYPLYVQLETDRSYRLQPFEEEGKATKRYVLLENSEGKDAFLEQLRRVYGI